NQRAGLRGQIVSWPANYGDATKRLWAANMQQTPMGGGCSIDLGGLRIIDRHQPSIAVKVGFNIGLRSVYVRPYVQCVIGGTQAPQRMTLWQHDKTTAIGIRH